MRRPWRQRLILRSLRFDPVGSLAMIAVAALCWCDPEEMRHHLDEATHEYIHEET